MSNDQGREIWDEIKRNVHLIIVFVSKPNVLVFNNIQNYNNKKIIVIYKKILCFTYLFVLESKTKIVLRVGILIIVNHAKHHSVSQTTKILKNILRIGIIINGIQILIKLYL